MGQRIERMERGGISPAQGQETRPDDTRLRQAFDQIQGLYPGSRYEPLLPLNGVVPCAQIHLPNGLVLHLGLHAMLKRGEDPVDRVKGFIRGTASGEFLGNLSQAVQTAERALTARTHVRDVNELGAQSATRRRA